MSADAAALLDRLEVERAHVVGASMGGMIGQTLAARHPDRVLSLCSIMSGPGGRRPSVMPRLSAIGVLLARPPREREAYADFVSRLFARIGSPGYPPDYDRIRERSLLMYDRCYYPTGTARQLMAIMASGDRAAELRRIVCPTLVIHGREDKLMPPSAGEAVARAVPGSRVELIEGMGHDLPRELWPRITGAIADNAARAQPAAARV
jgi:pimeloyl-ACP methyl ester carboxylesterase